MITLLVLAIYLPPLENRNKAAVNTISPVFSSPTHGVKALQISFPGSAGEK
jgi:hypothetical protein